MPFLPFFLLKKFGMFSYVAYISSKSLRPAGSRQALGSQVHATRSGWQGFSNALIRVEKQQQQTLSPHFHHLTNMAWDEG